MLSVENWAEIRRLHRAGKCPAFREPPYDPSRTDLRRPIEHVRLVDREYRDAAAFGVLGGEHGRCASRRLKLPSTRT